MATSPREVLLVGSVPVRPASRVFEIVSEHLGSLITRIPDGEMRLWLKDIWDSHAKNPMLEPAGVTKLNGRSPFVLPLYKPKAGIDPKTVRLGPYGYAQSARSSYAEFSRLREAGKIPLGTRYQLTMPGPGTSSYVVQMPGEVLLPIAAAALEREIEDVLAEIPAEDLAIQLDIAMEAEHEEYLRAPGQFDAPVHEIFHWSLEQMADAAAEVTNRIPETVELGFHICSIWHHDPAGGQDNNVLVDATNALMDRITRKVAYVHIPIVPEHDQRRHYEPLGRLRFRPGTKLILGLLNLSDGLDGAAKRIALAEQVVRDFGISFYCGLGMPHPRAEPALLQLGLKPATSELDREVKRSSTSLRPRVARGMDDPALARATEETLAEVLDLHRRAAEL